MKNKTTVSLRTLSVLLFCFLCIGGTAHAQSVPELEQAMEDAEDVVDAKKARHDVATANLNEMIGNFVTLHANLVSIKISATPAKNSKDLIVEFTKITEALIKSNLLTSAMRTMLANIETQRGICNTIWADVVLAQSDYELAVDAYNDAVSPEEQVTTVEVPQPSDVSKLYLCPGPCSTPFTTQVLATTSHQVSCDKEPHKASGYTYYSCPPDYPKVCPIPNQHKEKLNQLACRGPCGKDVPNLLGFPDDSSHQTTCQEKAYRSRRVRVDGKWYIKKYVPEGSSARCPQGSYYHCKIGVPCPNSANHAGSGETVTEKYIDANGNEVPNPSLLACGVHEKGTPGNHKKRLSEGSCGHHYHNCQIRDHMQQLCPTDGGRECTSRFHYVCQSHEHTYPDVTTLPCGHPVGTPGDHFRVSFSGCGHWDYYCYRLDHDGTGCSAYVHPDDRVSPDQKAGEIQGRCRHFYKPTSETITFHRLTQCPSGPNGELCSDGSYWVCAPHTHSYAATDTDINTDTDTTDTDTDTDPPVTPKATEQVCGHVYDPNSSSAYTHRVITCPTQNGLKCLHRSYYACRASEHTHSYQEKPTQPTGVKCANNNRGAGKCSYGRVVSGSDAYEHLRKCAAGHSYWSCNATAVSAHSWHKATTTPTPPTTQPTTPTPTPSYHACGIHQTSVSGDHSLQASCSRDSRCIAQSFYYCQHSSHTYRTAPPPPPPVVCPAHSWTGCGGTSSHATTCKAGHPYYTCNPSAVTAHKGHQKNTPVVCPAHSWTGCGGTSSHATTCKAGHPYYTCNPSAVTAHKWHVKAGVKCPAHAWTNCNGSSSHQTTCGRGHKYYTCNPDAVKAHKWH